MSDPNSIANEASRMLDLNQHSNALRLLVSAKQRFPNAASIHRVLAITLLELRKPEDALTSALMAQSLSPNDPTVAYLVGRALLAAHQYQESVKQFETTLSLDSGYAPAYTSLAQAYSSLGKWEESLAAAKQAAALGPDNPTAVANYFRRQQELGDVEEAFETLKQGYERGIREESFLSNLLLNSHCPDLPRDEVFDWHLRFGDYIKSMGKVEEHAFLNSREADRVIKIGFITRDLYAHSVGFFLRPVLEALRVPEFEVTIYHYPLKVDQMTDELKKLAARYRKLEWVQVKDLAKQVKQDRIDILIDLMGHARLGSFALFALRPAPVSVTMIGYPDTTGAPGVQYRVVDEITDPTGSEERSTEELVRLPGCFLCYSLIKSSPTPASERTGRFTFGSFNSIVKLNRSVIRVWSEILIGAPEACLILKANGLDLLFVQDRIASKFALLGIGRERLQFRGQSIEQTEHLAQYADVDLALDMFPYNGTTTTCEALSMGVPVLTYLGDRHSGRVSASLLNAVGLPEFVAKDREDYIAKAIEHAKNPEQVRALRATLPDQVRSSILMDAERYGEKIRQLLRNMWKKFCASA